MSSLIKEPVPLMPHEAADNGWHVEICRYCGGFGYTSGPSPFSDEVETQQCHYCCGTGRVAVKKCTVERPLNYVLLPFKTDEP